MSDNLLKKYGQPLVYRVINPLIDLLVRWKVKPNTITTIGLVISTFATVIFIYGGKFGERNDHSYIGWAGVVILFGGLFDMIDGRLARVGKMTSTFGALYDSVLDRYSEMIMFLGICWYLVAQSYFLSSLFAFIALIGSVMVSYIRARAESRGRTCRRGLHATPRAHRHHRGIGHSLWHLFGTWWQRGEGHGGLAAHTTVRDHYYLYVPAHGIGRFYQYHRPAAFGAQQKGARTKWANTVGLLSRQPSSFPDRLTFNFFKTIKARGSRFFIPFAFSIRI